MDFCKFIEEHCNSVTLNMNDTFGYACSDSEEICAWDLIQLKPLYAKYGSATFTAYAAVKKGCQPIYPLRTPKYIEARKEIVRLRKNRELWFDDD